MLFIASSGQDLADLDQRQSVAFKVSIRLDIKHRSVDFLNIQVYAFPLQSQKLFEVHFHLHIFQQLFIFNLFNITVQRHIQAAFFLALFFVPLAALKTVQ